MLKSGGGAILGKLRLQRSAGIGSKNISWGLGGVPQAPQRGPGRSPVSQDCFKTKVAVMRGGKGLKGAWQLTLSGFQATHACH